MILLRKWVRDIFCKILAIVPRPQCATAVFMKNGFDYFIRISQGVYVYFIRKFLIGTNW